MRFVFCTHCHSMGVLRCNNVFIVSALLPQRAFTQMFTLQKYNLLFVENVISGKLLITFDIEFVWHFSRRNTITEINENLPSFPIKQRLLLVSCFRRRVLSYNINKLVMLRSKSEIVGIHFFYEKLPILSTSGSHVVRMFAFSSDKLWPHLQYDAPKYNVNVNK